jgi:hypothetical protein
MHGIRLLHKALHSVTLRWVLMALLLFAQHGALTHVLAHASGEIESLVSSHHDNCEHGQGFHHHDGAPDAGSQCAFDLLYSELLGGVPLVDGRNTAETAISVAATPVAGAAASVSVPLHHARDPPFSLA